MSKKGQDNQRGINFQNKVALLYMLDHYRYANFTEIRFEGDNLEDFTLFFTDSLNNSTFFCNFEVKNWNSSLTLNKVKEIIKKEVKKGINRYSGQGQFFIVAPSFKEDCKEIETFRKTYFFNSKKDFTKTKEMYQKIYGNNPLFNWNEEEILFLKYVYLIEIKAENINKMIIDRFRYEDSFFYSEDNLENIRSRFINKIEEKSSSGNSLNKGEIQNTLNEFHKAEANKSESYDFKKDLSEVIADIEAKLKTKSGFETLNNNKYITPISDRQQAIFYITDKLKKRKFSLKSIRWFLEKILIKNCYFFQCLDLLEVYIKENNLTEEDKGFILEFIFKVYKTSSSGSSLQRSEFNSYSNERILEFLSKLSACQTVSDKIKEKFINFLENVIPDWSKELSSYSWSSDHYQHIPKLIEDLLNHSEKGLEIIFKKYNFTNEREELSEYNQPYYEYIEEFIDKDFKKHFPLVIKSLNDQFQNLYMSYGYESDLYKGYEIMGGGGSGWGSEYNLHVLPLEFVLFKCICKFYEKTEDWSYLKKSFIDPECDKNNPVFVKRSFIPFLLNQIIKSCDKKPEDNKFYKALEFILKIKKGFPSTEDILANKLRQIHSKIKDHYLERLINMILYKYSEEGISYSILTVQLLFQLIESGRLNFKKYLKKILLNENFKKHYIYERALRLLESRITNKNINNFFNEIKNDLDISKNKDLIYISITLDLQTSDLKKSQLFKLFQSSSKKDLDCLACIIEKDILNTAGSQFLKKALEIMKDHLDLDNFYKRAKHSEYLKKTIIQLIEKAINYDINLSEKIINLCVNDTNLCGENQNLHNQVAKGENSPSISTMRAHLCFAINSYIKYCNQKKDKESLEKLERAFCWIKLLLDLDGSLSNKIKDFPKPNYYLRAFAIIPLINLAHHEIRNELNSFKNNLGNEIKGLAFSIIDKTTAEIEKNNYTPFELFNKISHLFNYMRDLNEEEAEKFLSFVEDFRIAEANHLFIYYALFREKSFEEKGAFKSDTFKERLRNICKSNPDELKRALSFTIYKNIENRRQEGESQPDFEFFEKIKDYWVLLFENINKAMFFPLLRTLSFILKNKIYYNEYKEYFFQLIKKALENHKNSGDYFLHLDHILPAVSKNNPEDLAKILLLFLEKGDPVKGYIPFSYEVRRHLILEINKLKNKISTEKLDIVKEELQKYNEDLD